jgi:signal peptidase II
LRVLLIPGLVVIFDQLSKSWVKNNFQLWESQNILGSLLRFSYVRNTGIAFGISVGDFGMAVFFLSLLATGFIAWLSWAERKNHPLISTGLAFILGGAMGNLIDRCSILFTDPYRGVVDFIDVGWGSFRWYTFNIADAAVTIGITLYLLHSVLIRKPELAE